MSDNTQAAIERFLAKGGEIKRVGLNKHTYTKTEMKAIVRGDYLSDSDALALAQHDEQIEREFTPGKLPYHEDAANYTHRAPYQYVDGSGQLITHAA